MCEKYGSNIRRGIDEPALDRDKVWHFEAKLGYGDKVGPGDVYGTVQETDSILHSIMCPPRKRGTVMELYTGDFKVTDRIGKLRLEDGTVEEITLVQKWPVRVSRPYAGKLPPVEPTPCSPLPRAAPPASPVPSAPARPWCSTSLPSGAMWIWWFTSGAGSAATR